jgi:hypothetical protein
LSGTCTCAVESKPIVEFTNYKHMPVMQITFGPSDIFRLSLESIASADKAFREYKTFVAPLVAALAVPLAHLAAPIASDDTGLVPILSAYPSGPLKRQNTFM